MNKISLMSLTTGHDLVHLLKFILKNGYLVYGVLRRFSLINYL